MLIEKNEPELRRKSVYVLHWAIRKIYDLWKYKFKYIQNNNINIIYKLIND